MRKLTDRLRGHVPVEGSLAIGGQLDYGVLSRPAEPLFLLRHYSKAVAGKPDEVNRLQAKGHPLEITAKFDGDHVILQALLDGKPYPSAAFTTVDSDLSGDELPGDAAGRASFAPPHRGVFSIYIRHVDRTPGEHGGKKYAEVRQFATLAFQWPLAASGADADAVRKFEGALKNRAVWNDFPGFTANITGEVDARPLAGKVSVGADGGIELKLDDDVVQAWVQEQLESITMHRIANQNPASSRTLPILRFADDDEEHPLGRLLAVENGHFATSYRVLGDQITTVNRLLGGKNMTITVLDNETTLEGRSLPRSYVVQYWDEASGKLERAETVQDRWTRLDKWDLPAEHMMSSSSDGGFEIRRFQLRDHQLLPAKVD
jgi:hypothetical protein